MAKKDNEIAENKTSEDNAELVDDIQDTTDGDVTDAQAEDTAEEDEAAQSEDGSAEVQDDDPLEHAYEEVHDVEYALAEHEEHEAEHGEEHISLSSRLLRVLSILVIGVGIALWGGPKIAPMLPVGLKPVADFLSPQTDVSSQIAALQADFDARIAKIETSNTTQGATAQIKPALDRLTEQNAALAATVGAISDATKTLETSIVEIQAELTKIMARQAMTSQNGSVSEKALQDFEAKLAAIVAAQQKLNQSQSAAVDAQQDAENKLRLASATAALTDISEALETGRPFAKPISQLTKVDGLVVPAALADNAVTGIASRSDLQLQLPELARIALRTDAAAHSNNGLLGTFTAFLKSQVGTRSLEPQTGDDLDAVLSRIEAALNAHQLGGAFAETNKLSASAQQTMGSWIASLAQLDAATNAVQTLQQQLKIN